MSRAGRRAAGAGLALSLLAAGCAPMPGPGMAAVPHSGAAVHGAAPAPDALRPTVVMGKEPVDVSAMLGQPTLKRSEPPGEVWQYREPDCVLHVFFYRGLDGRYTVAYLDRVDRVTPPLSTDACFATVRQRARERDRTS